MTLKIEQIDLLKKNDLNRFVNLPWTIYKNDPHWVPPLKMAVKDVLNLKKHPFYKTADIWAYVAVKDGQDVGRILAINNRSFNDYHQKKMGHFGFFESIDDKKVAHLLLQTAEEKCLSLGLAEFEGPMNPGTNYECGLLINDLKDAPQIMMTYNPKYYEELLESFGLTKAKDLIAYHSPAKFTQPQIILDIAKRAEKKSKINVRNLNLKNWNHELDTMFDIYNSAWEANWGFVPMTKEEFYHTAKDLKSIVNPELVQIAEVDGKAAGFILTLPDLNQVFKEIPTGNLSPMAIYKILTAKKRMTRCRVITMGIKKEFRKIGIETILYTRNHEAIKKMPLMKEIEMSWILEDNLEMNKPLIRMGATPYKRYRIYSKKA